MGVNLIIVNQGQAELIVKLESDIVDCWSIITAQKARLAKYNELLFAVNRKFSGELRHDTALRYIRQTEGIEFLVVIDCHGKTVSDIKSELEVL